MKNILKNILAVLDQKERKHFFILLLLDIVISIVDILSLVFLLWIIQFYIQPDAGNKLSVLPAWLLNKHSVLLIAFFLVMFSIKNLAGFYITRAHFKFMSSVAIRISRNKLLHYQQAEFKEFIDIDSSVHIRNICFQPFEFSQYMLTGIQQVITQSSLIFITIVAIIMFNAKLFLLLLIILLPPVVVVFGIIKKKLDLAKDNIRSNNERSFNYVLDALKGYVESNVYDRNDFFLQRFILARQKFSTYLFNSMAMQSMPGRIIEIFAVLGLFILILIANWSGNSDSATFITIGAFMAAAYKIIPGIVKLINVSSQMKAYEFSLTDLKPTEETKRQAVSKETITGIKSIELKNVSFQYDQQPVLKELDITIDKGDFIGITGGSGKGKTTIMNILLGFLPVTGGEICIDQKPCDQTSLKKYWPFIAYVRQQGFFIHDTLVRNITLEEQHHDEEQLQYAIRASGLDQVLAKFPEGLEKVITENGKNISGGQQQRIAIARALYKKVDLILLDEPFNELDDEASLALLQHFQELAAAGKMVLMITHDKKSMACCNKIISLDE